jgi:hypothetical protein
LSLADIDYKWIEDRYLSQFMFFDEAAFIDKKIWEVYGSYTKGLRPHQGSFGYDPEKIGKFLTRSPSGRLVGLEPEAQSPLFNDR